MLPGGLGRNSVVYAGLGCPRGRVNEISTDNYPGAFKTASKDPYVWYLMATVTYI